MSNRYYGAETQANIGKKIFSATQSSCPFATSSNNTPLPAHRSSPSRPTTPSRVPWATTNAGGAAPTARSDIIPPGYMRKHPGNMSPMRRTAAPYATTRSDERNIPPSVQSHLDQVSRKRPVSAPRMAHTPSVKGTPYATDHTPAPVAQPPSRYSSPARQQRLGVDSCIAPWANTANMYDQARNGKKTAIEKFDRPGSARERRRAYGDDLRAQMANRDSERARSIISNRTTERRMSMSQSVSGLTRGLGERRWM